ncbi:MAG: hypothetical protein WD119_01905 [Pirellulaceae bacterium]
MKTQPFAFFLASCALLPSLSAFAADTSRPGAPHLFPDDTLAYARIDDAKEFKERMGDSSIGRMLNDPELRPFVSDVYGVATELFDQISDRVGLSLDELLKIPQGEVAIAVIPLSASADEEDEAERDEASPRDESPEAIRQRLRRRRRAENAFGFAAVIETKESTPLAERLLTRLGDRLIQGRYVRRDTSFQETKITRYAPPTAIRPDIEYCQRDGVTLIGVGEGIVADMLARWEGDDAGPTLARNADFAAAMGPCIGAEDTQPQVTFFLDPYQLVRRVIRGQGGSASLVWPLIEKMGAERFRGVAGSSFFGGDFLESITHIHVLIDTPRDGLLSVVRPATGDITPPAWVPADVMSYTTLYWDLPNTYAGVGRIVDQFQGDDSLERLVEEPLKKRFDLEFETEVIEQLTGRVTITRWYERPAKLNSQTQLWGLEVNDPAKAAATLEKFAEAFPGQVRKDNEGTVTVYTGREREGNFPQNFRRPTPCLALLGNHVLISDSREFLKRTIRANAGALPRLKGLPEYDLIAVEVGGMLEDEPPFLFSFMRSEEMLRQFYEMAAAPGAAEFLKQAGESNPVMAKLAKAFEEHTLPPYDTLTKYFAPSGGFAYDSPTGIHYTSFSVKAD